MHIIVHQFLYINEVLLNQLNQLIQLIILFQQEFLHLAILLEIELLELLQQQMENHVG